MSMQYYLPAEWERQSAIQLTWPHAGTDWRDCLDDINRTYVHMAQAITSHERLIVVTPEPQAVEALLSPALTQEQAERVTYCQCPTNDTWARDHGFITLLPTQSDTTGSGCAMLQSEPRRLLDFRFNGWGEKFRWELDNRINSTLHQQGIVEGERIDLDDVVLEGGSIESDGRGTIFTTSQCLLAPHRNQPLTRQEIEGMLMRTLCAKRIVWIDHGQLSGDDTDGHIDTLVRTAPGDTLLYVRCDDHEDEHWQSLHLMEQQLRTLRTLPGKPYRLMPLPMPHPVCHDGERLPATYANFVIMNGAVICPTYDQPDNDARAMEVLREAFPGREIIGIDSRTVVRQHGSLHCCTMQLPE